MIGEKTEFLLWKTGGHLFGLELPFCREIVNSVSITYLPRSPAFVRGLANLRGSVVSVIDLEVLLGYREKSAVGDVSTIVRLRASGYPIAVSVDSISDTVFIESNQLEPTPANLTDSESNYIRKVAKTPGGLVLVPNLESIASRIN
jgi:purine-binding chemotaxis protein CheW